jgi:hypothetical protein
MVSAAFNVHILTESLKKRIASLQPQPPKDHDLSIFLFCGNKLLSGADSTLRLTQNWPTSRNTGTPRTTSSTSPSPKPPPSDL